MLPSGAADGYVEAAGTSGSETATQKSAYNQGAPATLETVEWTYRILLGRDPESDAVVANCMALPDQGTVVGNVLRSSEFRGRVVRDIFNAMQTPFVQGTTPQGFRLWVDLRDTGVSIPCLFGTYEPAETQFLATVLAEGDGFIDVGANVGWHTMNASLSIGPTGRIYAFEPRTETRELLEASVAANGLQGVVLVHGVAVGDSSSDATLYWPQGTANPGGSSLARPLDGEWREETVRVCTLDSMAINHRIKALKIDIEGAEPMAIHGGAALIHEHRPVILSEVHDEQLRAVSGSSAHEYVGQVAAMGYEPKLLNADGTLDVLSPRSLKEGCLLNVVFWPL
jgi:FkbM family methyltransferase